MQLQIETLNAEVERIASSDPTCVRLQQIPGVGPRGHGVPAALIASMIKVATHAANGCASDPGEFMRSVGSILNKHVRGQLVSAAYLWMDMSARTATYSAAGHPPLVRWRKKDGTLTRIESNGLLFGINVVSEYPVCNFPLSAGDRFVLYTDGLTEPENQAGGNSSEKDGWSKSCATINRAVYLSFPSYCRRKYEHGSPRMWCSRTT